MKPESLLAALAKTERAKTQIQDIDRQIRAFFEGNPYEVRSDLNDDGNQQIWRFALTKKIPREIAVMAGEILHNLRSPLDQMACTIARLFHQSEAGVCFPFGRDLNEFEAELRKQKKIVPAHDFIRATKPYKGGTDLLWSLHHLNRRDKHRVGLVPINMPAATMASYICFWRGLPLVVGCKTGKHLLMEKPFKPEDLIETGKPLALYDVRPGAVLFGDANTPGDESLEFMTTTPGAKFDANFQPALTIAFNEVGLEGQPIIAILNQMRDLVEGILLTCEKQFFP